MCSHSLGCTPLGIRDGLGEYALEGFSNSLRCLSEPSAAAESQGLADLMLQRAHTVATGTEIPNHLAAGLLLPASRGQNDVDIWQNNEPASIENQPQANDEDCEAVKVRFSYI